MPPFLCVINMAQIIRLATRESALAMWQANYVKKALEAVHSGLRVEIIGMTTQGDRDKSSPLTKLGGKGVFVKELEVALLEGRADIAVHSMKDVPSVFPDGLGIAAICEREDPRDAFVSQNAASFEALSDGGKLGSSSLSRRLQLQAQRPELNYLDVRGNVETRLRKLDEGEFDGIILAVAGLKRLELGHRITQAIDPELSIPAAGQGAVGIEVRLDDERTLELLKAINHPESFDCVTCERAVSIGLGASCDLPIAAFATLKDDLIRLTTYVAVGDKHLRVAAESSRADAMRMAEDVTRQLIAQGAGELKKGQL
jgi:hydroxymethylbilane synthase